MTGICGWYQAAGASPDTQAELAAMSDAFVCGHDHPPAGFTHIHQAGAVVAGNEQPESCLAQSVEAGLLVVLTGRCYFNINTRGQPQLCMAADILKRYRRQGVALLPELKGHFSIAIVDSRNARVVLAVDRSGVRPLAFADCGEQGLVFASLATAVAAHPRVDDELDTQALYNYLYFHMIPAPRTAFASVRKLPAAHYALWEAGRVQLHCYWRPDFVGRRQHSFNDLRGELKTIMRDSVARQYEPQRTGAFLSGGIDSSTVSGLLGSLESSASVFSIGFDDEAYNEIRYARITAKHFGLDLHEYFVTTEDVLQLMPRAARSYDEPFGNSSVIPTYFCARMAKEHGRPIMLAGDAGDELFGGNERYVTQEVFNYYNKLPSLIRSGLLEPLLLDSKAAEHFFLTRKAKSYMRQARVPMPERLQTYNFLHRVASAEMFDAGFLQQVDTAEPVDDMRAVYDAAQADSMLDRMLFLDWKITLADNDIRKVNRMTELAGVDVRYPFLDDDLVEFSTHVPPSLKIRRRNLRYFFKRAMHDFLPVEVINKSKHGFGLPFGVWLKKSVQLQEFIYDNLAALKQRRIVRPQYIEQIVDAHRGEHAAYYGTMVWVLAMLELWLATRSKS